MAISKTDFMRGMQCPKMLWLDKHRPALKVIPEETRRKLDAGTDFGDRAMGMFGPYEEMTVYRPGTRIPDTAAMVRRPQEHLQAWTPVIFQAALSTDNNYCAVDILRKTESGYDFYEVKNSPKVDPQFVRDAGFQYYIMARCKVKIGKIFIVIHGPDEEDPFVPVDVTKEAKGYYRWINDNIWDLNRMQKQGEEPETEPGDRCSDPYECWYYGYCHSPRREQLSRIARNETHLNALRRALSRPGAGPQELSSVRERAEALSRYLESEDWKQDFADDEAGLLPGWLRRGVLSEDGIYNVLEEYGERMGMR